jgi:hypothetical protein
MLEKINKNLNEKIKDINIKEVIYKKIKINLYTNIKIYNIPRVDSFLKMY